MSDFHSEDFPAVELPLAMTVIVVFVTLAIAMLCMIVHLVHKTYKECKKKRAKEDKKISILFLAVTIIGLLSFEASLSMTIILVIHIFLFDDTIKSRMISSQFFFQIYPVCEYCIGIFDALGHLFMLFVFIARFQYSFNHEIFNPSKWFICCIYSILFILSLFAMFISVYFMPSEMDANHLMSLELVWEMCVESMIVFLLFMFVSNLYKLLKFSLWAHLKKNGNPKQLISEITKISLEASDSKKSNRNNSRMMVTIDGCAVDPFEKTMKYNSDHDHNTDNDKDDACAVTPQPAVSPVAYYQSLEVLTVMTKMTVLVIIAAIVSYASIIGNFIIETNGVYNEKNIGGTTAIDHDAIWVFVLPVFDIVVTATMLYLQFNFTHKVYKIMCHCVDLLVLRCMLSIVAYHWKESDDSKCNCEETDLETKSTVISGVTNLSHTAPSEDIQIQIEMQNVIQS